MKKINRRRSRSSDFTKLGHFTLLFCIGDGKEMFKDLQRTSTATALLIKPLFGDILVAVDVIVCLSSLL